MLMHFGAPGLYLSREIAHLREFFEGDRFLALLCRTEQAVTRGRECGIEHFRIVAARLREVGPSAAAPANIGGNRRDELTGFVLGCYVR